MKAIAPKDWKMKAVQIDLARQMEPLDKVLQFFDLAARSGYNTVQLYLEDRIATLSYSYADPAETYTEAEVRRMVEYAAEKGLELIPVVSNLGHAERFLGHIELRGMSELRGEIAGRFTPAGIGHHHAVCPSLEESYEFFDRYIAEVAALFPSKYFHVGLDEVFDMGYCELCKARLAAGETRGDLFVTHVLRTHKMLTALGKTMIIWDDMFEHFPEKRELLPRDIVMCCWSYDWVADKVMGQFSNCLWEDRFAEYERLGFPYIMACHTRPYNLDSFTQYSKKYSPLGGLMTIWERAILPLPELYPLVANGGLLWNGVCEQDSRSRMVLAMKQELGGADVLEELTEALAAAAFFEGRGRNSLQPPIAPVTLEVSRQEREAGYILSQLNRAVDRAQNNRLELPQIGWDIIEAYRYKLDSFLLDVKICRLNNALLEYRSGIRQCDTQALAKEFADCTARMKGLHQDQLAMWERTRPGLTHERFDSQFAGLLDKLGKAESQARSASLGECGCLLLRFFLPDGYGAENSAFTLLYGDGSEERLGGGVYKGGAAYFDRLFPIAGDRELKAVRIEAWGYGGIGFTWLEAIQQGVRRIPVEISHQSGIVTDAEHLLVDDSMWCFMGEHHINPLMEEEQPARVHHVLEIKLG